MMPSAQPACVGQERAQTLRLRRTLRMIAATVVPVAMLTLVAAPAHPQARSPAGSSASRAAAPTASEAFWEALRLDDLRGLTNALLRGSSANAVDPKRGPAIVYAAREKSPQTLAYLAGLTGVRLDVENNRGETALMLSALHGDVDNVRLLVERGAEVNKEGWTPLHYAAAGGQVPAVEYLIEHGAYVDAHSPNRTTPLMMAARHKHTHAVRALVAAGADPTQRNEAGLSAADYMKMQGEDTEAEWLRLQAKAFEQKYGTVEKPRLVRPNEGLRPQTPGGDHTRDGSAPSGLSVDGANAVQVAPVQALPGSAGTAARPLDGAPEPDPADEAAERPIEPAIAPDDPLPSAEEPASTDKSPLRLPFRDSDRWLSTPKDRLPLIAPEPPATGAAAPGPRLPGSRD